MRLPCSLCVIACLAALAQLAVVRRELLEGDALGTSGAAALFVGFALYALRMGHRARSTSPR